MVLTPSVTPLMTAWIFWDNEVELPLCALLVSRLSWCWWGQASILTWQKQWDLISLPALTSSIKPKKVATSNDQWHAVGDWGSINAWQGEWFGSQTGHFAWIVWLPRRNKFVFGIISGFIPKTYMTAVTSPIKSKSGITQSEQQRKSTNWTKSQPIL